MFYTPAWVALYDIKSCAEPNPECLQCQALSSTFSFCFLRKEGKHPMWYYDQPLKTPFLHQLTGVSVTSAFIL